MTNNDQDQNPMPQALASIAFPIADLKPDPRNARAHNARNLDAIEHSLQTFGWRGVVIAHADTKQILAGHGRVEAAKRLGWTHAPVLFVSDDKARAMAFALADNRSAELAEWNWDELSANLRELDMDEAMSIGFTADELNSLLSLDEPTQALTESELRAQDAIGTQAAAKKDQVLIHVQAHKDVAEQARQAIAAALANIDATVLP